MTLSSSNDGCQWSTTPCPQLQQGPRCRAVASCSVRLQLADDVGRALARHRLDLRLIAQLLLVDDALVVPRTVPQLSKDRRLAQRGQGVAYPGSRQSGSFQSQISLNV